MLTAVSGAIPGSCGLALSSQTSHTPDISSNNTSKQSHRWFPLQQLPPTHTQQPPPSLLEKQCNQTNQLNWFYSMHFWSICKTLEPVRILFIVARIFGK